VIPLRDDVPGRSTPLVTIALIAINAAAFLYQLSLVLGGDGGASDAGQALVAEFGAVPCRLSGACASADEFPSPLVTVLTSMFLHGGVLHISANMVYLWIFGDNVEDTLGHGRFLFLYLVSGFVAATVQALATPHSHVALIGASGAVSGVLGAYLLLFPYASIVTLVTFGVFVRLIHIPAVLVLGFWLVLQLVIGFLTMSVSIRGAETGGVAWFALIGGFLAGVVLLLLLRPRTSVRSSLPKSARL
jgi:membrane associated rhomboid family serine protease